MLLCARIMSSSPTGVRLRLPYDTHEPTFLVVVVLWLPPAPPSEPTWWSSWSTSRRTRSSDAAAWSRRQARPPTTAPSPSRLQGHSMSLKVIRFKSKHNIYCCNWSRICAWHTRSIECKRPRTGAHNALVNVKSNSVREHAVNGCMFVNAVRTYLPRTVCSWSCSCTSFASP